MRKKSDFVLHFVDGEGVVVPVGERTREFHGMIRLNESGSYLWEHAMDGEFSVESLGHVLMERYEVSEETALRAAEKFIQTLLGGGILES